MGGFETTPADLKALLPQRINQLGLKLEGSPVEHYVKEFYRELEQKGLKHFRPPCYLTDEWGCPSGEPIIGIPFYLADSKLARLEKEMDDLEDSREIRMYLRHEAGHAFNYAYKLYETSEWRELFGPFNRPYREKYRPVPFDRSFVRHIEGWYAQKHPDEDFAETFAVWLNPDSNWQERYAGWPALKKLQYMDELMKQIAAKPPRITTQEIVDPLPSIKTTLREHYRRKRKHYGPVHPTFYDSELGRLFSDAPQHAANKRASTFLSRIRKEVRRKVADWTGAYQHTIDQVLEGMIERCRERNLRLAVPEDQAKLDFIILLTVQTMNNMHGGRHRVAL